MVDYNQQEQELLQSLYRAVKRANYWTQQVSKATNKKQLELWVKLEDEAYGQVENCIYLLDWLEKKKPKDRELEPELDIILQEPATTQMLISKRGFHRSFGGVLIKDGE